VDGVVLPIGVELIEPPVITAPDELKLFAVTRPVKVEVPSTIKLPFAEMLPVFEIVTPVEPYPPPTVSESTLLAAVEVKVVNVPAAGVVAPITVALIPVAVVLKLPEVKSKLLTPVEIED
jgi:hypothetical protein